MKVAVIPIVVDLFGIVPKRLDEVDFRGKIEFIQKSPGDLRKLASESPEKKIIGQSWCGQ